MVRLFSRFNAFLRGRPETGTQFTLPPMTEAKSSAASACAHSSTLPSKSKKPAPVGWDVPTTRADTPSVLSKVQAVRPAGGWLKSPNTALYSATVGNRMVRPHIQPNASQKACASA